MRVIVTDNGIDLSVPQRGNTIGARGNAPGLATAQFFPALKGQNKNDRLYGFFGTSRVDAHQHQHESAVALYVRTLIRCVVVVSSPPGFDDVLIVKAAAEGVMRSPVQIVTGGVLGARAERPGVGGRLLMIDHLVARPAASKVAHGALDGFRRSTTACASLATTLSRWCYLLAKRPAVTMPTLGLQTTIAAAVRG